MSESNEKTTESMELPIEESIVSEDIEASDVQDIPDTSDTSESENQKTPAKKKSSSHSKASEGVMRAASILIISNFIASILGFLRQIVITSAFGMSVESDSFYLAFSIPDMIYNVLVGGGLSSAFIPVFSAYLADNNEDEGYRMASTILNLVAIVSGTCFTAGTYIRTAACSVYRRLLGRKRRIIFYTDCKTYQDHVLPELFHVSRRNMYGNSSVL